MSDPEHIVELKIGDVVIDTWQSFTVQHDFLSPADTFDMTFGVASWDPHSEPEPIVTQLRAYAAGFQQVELQVDGAPQLKGYLDSVDGDEDASGPTVRVQGRDIGGQVVDCSMPLGFNIVGLPLVEVLERALSPWSIPVVVGNEENRVVLSVKKKQFSVALDQLPTDPKWWKDVVGKPVTTILSSDEWETSHPIDDVTAQPQSIVLATTVTGYKAAIENRKLQHELKVDPGQTRWDWIAKLLETQNLLGWFSADGKFVVGTPRYDQDPMFHATRAVEYPGLPMIGNRRSDQNNIESGGYTTRPGARYSHVYVFGRQGKDPIKTVAIDNGLVALGVSRPFYHTDHDIKSIEEAQRVADRMLVDSRIKDDAYTCVMTGFGQGDRLYAFDTIWDVWDDSPAVYFHGQLWCSRIVQRYDLENGPSTEATLQPKGIIEVPT
jgi:prophage tail gpP-like protein